MATFDTVELFLESVRNGGVEEGSFVTGLDLAGAALRGIHASEVKWNAVNLDGADLRESRLPRAFFNDCRLAGANLTGVVVPIPATTATGISMVFRRPGFGTMMYIGSGETATSFTPVTTSPSTVSKSPLILLTGSPK